MTQNPTNPFKKRTGRNRIKLDAAMLNRAKTLILQRATTSQLADQLKISRTFAWRLRKNMLNDCMNSSENGLSDQDVIPLPQQPGCSNDSEEKLMVRKLIKREKDKIRKPNVFINEEMYDRAKEFVNLNMSTLEIARHLNISQMTAWKLRDAITKGIKLTFRQKTSPVPKNTQSQSNARREKLLSKKQKKAQERLERDKQITQEILKIVQEDYSIQYWKISEKLSQKVI
uniref:Uncharacterized protein n=1 Tax=Megaselia scalaris TaxID=36166 RepID=T1GM72_MEGSC